MPQNIRDYASLSPQTVLTIMQTSATGLTDDDVAKRLKKYGPNSLKSQTVSWYTILARQLKSSFVYLLSIATVLAFILGETIDGMLILGFITVNTLLGFIQEFRSEKTVTLLKKYVEYTAKLVRNGTTVRIPVAQIVPGDIVILEAGDLVPADLRIYSAHNLFINESILTGESIDVQKNETMPAGSSQELYQATTLAFRGTQVTRGNGVGIVVATGQNTQVGTIATLASSTKRISNFEQNINQFSNFLLFVTGTTLTIVVIAHIAFSPHLSIPDLTIFAIALAVGVIPEALPLVTTFSLSHGARILAKQNVIIKRLSAIEDLGGIEILCSDKTGTLTENSLSISDIYAVQEPVVFYAGLGIEEYSQETHTPKDAFDSAIYRYLSQSDQEKLATYQKLSVQSFDPERKRNSTLVSRESETTLIVRGAPEDMLSHAVNVTRDSSDKILSWIELKGQGGNRCLAIGIRTNFSNALYTHTDELHNITFLGVIAFIDPLKETTVEAVSLATQLGVQIKILTGDSPDVAGAIGVLSGIITDHTKVMTGTVFNALSTQQKHEAVNEYQIFARVAPEEKYQIVSLLMENNQVGFLGEGINDTPSLKLAHVGLVVKGASDIAQETADIVLLTQNLKVIIQGIAEGRKTFTNTMKYLRATLLSNFGNFYAVGISSLFIPFLPMLPIQILLLNLLSDFPMISISTDNVSVEDLKTPKKYETKDLLLSTTILGVISTLFDFLYFSSFKDSGEQTLQTAWFIGSVLTELFVIYSIRTDRFFLSSRQRPSLPLVILTIGALVLTVTIPYTAIGQTLFGFIALPIQSLFQIIIIAIGYVTTTELVKLINQRVNQKQQTALR